MSASVALPFERQHLEAPLNDDAKRELRALASKRIQDYSLHSRIKDAINYLDEAVGPLNERAQEQKAARTKKLAKLAEKGLQEDEHEHDEYQTFQNKVEELTNSMDKSIRQVIDHRIWLESLPDGLKHVSDNASDIQPTQRTTQRSINPTQDATPAPFDPDAEEEEDINLNTQLPAYEDTPSALLHAALATQSMKHNAKTLTEKYARDNDYIGFYSNRFIAQNPGENPPPMPAASIWFAAEERRNKSHVQPGRGDVDEEMDSDVEIAAERISIKCPITLLPFTDPVTSQICNHSYEKAAIESMIANSSGPKDLAPEAEAGIAAMRSESQRQARKRQLLALQPIGVKCPECRAFFQAKDLAPNPVLKRRVQRELAAQEKEVERHRKRLAREEGREGSDIGGDSDEDDEDDLPRGTQRRPVGLESSPFGGRDGASDLIGRENREKRLKRERLSGRVSDSQGLPNGTQMTERGVVVVDLGDSDDEDENGDMH